MSKKFKRAPECRNCGRPISAEVAIYNLAEALKPDVLLDEANDRIAALEAQAEKDREMIAAQARVIERLRKIEPQVIAEDSDLFEDGWDHGFNNCYRHIQDTLSRTTEGGKVPIRTLYGYAIRDFLDGDVDVEDLEYVADERVNEDDIRVRVEMYREEER